MTHSSRRRGRRRRPVRRGGLSFDENSVSVSLDLLLSVISAYSEQRNSRYLSTEADVLAEYRSALLTESQASPDERNCTHCVHVLSCLSRIAAAFCYQLRNFSSHTEARTLMHGLDATLQLTHQLLQLLPQIFHGPDDSSKKSLSPLLIDLKRTLESSAGGFCEALEIAIFLPPFLARLHSTANLNDGPQSSSSTDDCTSDSFIQPPSIRNVTGHTSRISGSDLDLPSQSSERKHRKSTMDRSGHLRLNALNTLSAIAHVSPYALIPHWSRFLPENEGVQMQGNGHTKQTLANIVLYERNELLRSASVSTLTALLVGSWRYTNSRIRDVTSQRRCTSYTGDAPNATAGHRSQAFVSLRVRVMRVCTALYSVAATAVRNETSSKILAQVMKLCAELSFNARFPSIAMLSIVQLVSAIRQRVANDVHVDLTSRSAALACLGAIISANLEGFSEFAEEFKSVLSLILDVLGHRDNSPVAEALTALQSLLQSNAALVFEAWSSVGPSLKTVLEASTDDPVIRLHVVRCIETALSSENACCHENTSSVTCQRNSIVSSSKVTSQCRLEIGELCVNDLWTIFLYPALSDRFHSVRTSAVQSFEHVFRGSTMVAPPHTAMTLSTIGQLLLSDGCSGARGAAAKALQCSPINCENGHCSALDAYAVLLEGFKSEHEYSVRAKIASSLSNFVSRYHGHLIGHRLDFPDRRFLTYCALHLRSVLRSLATGDDCTETLSSCTMDTDQTSFRANSVWSLGVFLGCLARVESPPETFRGLLDVVAEQFDCILQVTSRIVCSESEAPKVRWNGCHVLSQLHPISVDSSDLSDVVVEGVAWLNERVRQSIPTILDALCSAVFSVNNVRVQISASKALRALLNGWMHTDCGLVRATFARVASRQDATFFAETCDTRPARKTGVPSTLATALRDELAALVVELILNLSQECLQDADLANNVSCESLFSAIWTHAALPDYALKALHHSDFREGGSTTTEDLVVATELWASLAAPVKCSIIRAGELASRARAASPGRERLLSVWKILQK